jgi:hypothetical protein
MQRFFSTNRNSAWISVVFEVATEACPQASGTHIPAQRPTKQASAEGPVFLGIQVLLRFVVFFRTRMAIVSSPMT